MAQGEEKYKFGMTLRGKYKAQTVERRGIKQDIFCIAHVIFKIQRTAYLGYYAV